MGAPSLVAVVSYEPREFFYKLSFPDVQKSSLLGKLRNHRAKHVNMAVVCELRESATNEHSSLSQHQAGAN